jgi:hypothetical protein
MTCEGDFSFVQRKKSHPLVVSEILAMVGQGHIFMKPIIGWALDALLNPVTLVPGT